MRSQSDSLIFRATLESWLGRFLLPFFFMGLALVTIVNLAKLSSFVTGIGLSLLLVLGFFQFAFPMLINWIRLDHFALSAYINGRHFQVSWSEVIAAWIVNRGPYAVLFLGTNQGTVTIPLKFFNPQAIWNRILIHASPASVDPLAYQRLPDYRRWTILREQLTSSVLPSHRVIDHWGIQLIGWTGLTLLCIHSIYAVLSAQAERLLIFAPGFFITILLLSNWGITEFDSDGIKRRTITGAWMIRWDEIESIELGPLDLCLVLEGGHKRVSSSGPFLWIRPGRDDLITLLQAQAEHRNLPMRRSILAVFKFSRNSQVRSK